MAKKHARSTPKPQAGSPASGGSHPPAARPLLPHPAPASATGDAGRREALLVALGLLLLAGLHLGWRVQPTLRYQQSAPPFFSDAPFFARFTGAPGGLLDYLAAGLAQLSFHNWLGTAAFTAILGCILLCTRRLLGCVGKAKATAVAGGLVALLAALPGRYESHLERTTVGILVALGAASLWQVASTWRETSRLAFCWVLAAVVFHAAGTLPVALFVMMATLIEWAVRRQPWPGLGCALAGLVVPLWAWYRPAFVPFAAVRQWGSELTLALHALAFLFIPAGLLTLAIAGRWAGGKRFGRVWRFAWMPGLIGVLALWWWSLDTSRQALAQLEQSVGRQDWSRALTVAKRVHAFPAAGRIQLARALAHAGRLPEDLFAFPQTRGLELLPGYSAGLDMARAEAETLLELGQVNLAEHMAHESLELDGPRPDTLRLLAHINLLKDRPEAARVFLNRLRLAPFHRAEAERELQLLAADPGGGNRSELNAIRARMPRTDEPDGRLQTEPLLRQLLKANPTNRMACDFLLAQRLLNAQLEELVADLRHLDVFGDSVLPRPCEEALLFYQDRASGKSLALRGRQIRPASIQRYRRFTDLLQRYPGQPAAARAALAPEFGDTFWFYTLFGETAPVSTAVTHSPQP